MSQAPFGAPYPPRPPQGPSDPWRGPSTGGPWGPPPPTAQWGPPGFRGVRGPSTTGGLYGPPAGWRPPGAGPGWGPPPARRAARGVVGCLAVAGFVVVAITAVMVIGGAVLFAGMPGETFTPTPHPTTPATYPPPPEPSPTPPPEPPPPPEPVGIPDREFTPLPAPNSDDPAWVSVQQAALYAVEFPDLSACPAPALLETMSSLEPYAAKELACLQNAWRPVLAGLGLPSTDIPHYYYEGSTATSACGSMTAPAFYCSADGGSIYLGEDLLQGTSWDPIWAKDLVSHEYGHHLQGVSGFFDAIYDLPPGNETVRRNEIQATCLGFGMLRRDDSITLDREFYDTLEPHLRAFLDDDIHGSSDSLANWGMRGFHADRVGECNTWVVPGAQVK